jgi:GcrA cell cycle regulator
VVSRTPEISRLYARCYNFPTKVANLSAKIAAMRDEAKELGFTQEAAHLGAMAVFADCILGNQAETRARGWTDEEILTLKRLWLQGLSAAKITKHINKSRSAICAAAIRYNLPARKARGITQ